VQMSFVCLLLGRILQASLSVKAVHLSGVMFIAFTME
jgi:hypothetical protein